MQEKKTEDERKERIEGQKGIEAHACFSVLVSHGFVFMNGFVLVALREIVLSSLLTASILSLLPPPSATECRTASDTPSGGFCRAITVRMEDSCESIFLTVLVVPVARATTTSSLPPPSSFSLSLFLFFSLEFKIPSLAFREKLAKRSKDRAESKYPAR